MTATAVIAPSASEDAGVDPRQREEDRQPGEEDGSAGRRGRRDREPGIGSPRQLLPETVDDEQRVVDADAKSDHGSDVRDEQAASVTTPSTPKVTMTPHRQHQRQTGRDHGAGVIKRIRSATGSPSRSARERSSCCCATSSAISGERPVT